VSATEVTVTKRIVGDIDKFEDPVLKLRVREETGVDERDDHTPSCESRIRVCADRKRKESELAFENVPEDP